MQTGLLNNYEIIDGGKHGSLLRIIYSSLNACTAIKPRPDKTGFNLMELMLKIKQVIT